MKPRSARSSRMRSPRGTRAMRSHTHAISRKTARSPTFAASSTAATRRFEAARGHLQWHVQGKHPEGGVRVAAFYPARRRHRGAGDRGRRDRNLALGTGADSSGRLQTRLLQVMAKRDNDWEIVVYHNVD